MLKLILSVFFFLFFLAVERCRHYISSYRLLFPVEMSLIIQTAFAHIFSLKTVDKYGSVQTLDQNQNLHHLKFSQSLLVCGHVPMYFVFDKLFDALFGIE